MRLDRKKQKGKRERRSKPKPRDTVVIMPHVANAPVNLMHPMLMEHNWVLP